MTDSYRLPFASPGNSHDFEEGMTSTKEWQEMTWDTRPPLDDPDKKGDQSLIDPETGAPVCVPKDFEKDYRSLTHQGRIRILNNYFHPEGASFKSLLDPRTQLVAEKGGSRRFYTPDSKTKGEKMVVARWLPDPHEYRFVEPNKIECRLAESSEGAFEEISSSQIGEQAHAALVAYFKSLGDDPADSGLQKTKNGFLVDDSTDVKPDAEASFRTLLTAAQGKSTVDFIFNESVLEPIEEGSLQECFLALVRYGYFNKAQFVSIKDFKVTFTLTEADAFLNQLFGQSQLSRYNPSEEEFGRDYQGPILGSIQYYIFEGDPANRFDDVMESMAVYRARENAFTTPVETDYDYAASLPLGKFGMINENVPFGLAYQFIPILVPLDSVDVSTGLGTAKLVNLAEMEIPGYFTRFTHYNQLNAIQLPQGWRLPKPEELAVFTRTIASDVTVIHEDETMETVRYNYDAHPECYVAGRSTNGNTVPMARIWLTDQPAPPLKPGFTQQPILIEGDELRSASPYINLKVGSMMTHEELLFLMEFCRVANIEQPLFQLATNSAEKTTQIYDGQLYHLYEGVIPRIILEKALEGLNTLLAQGSSATSVWDDEPIDYAQLVAMRNYVEALLDNDFEAAAEAKERFQATQDQAVDGQSARKWGTITGVLSLFIFATITPWGQSAMQKLKSMGKLPVGLAELHQKALAKVKLAKYHGQERVRAMITQALLKKARGEKVKSLVILGEPGTGKSALVIQIFYEFSKKYPEEAKKLGLLKGDITEINKELGIVGADSRVADAFWKTVFRQGMVTFIDEIHRLQGLGSHSGSPIAQFNEGAKEGLEQRLGFVIGASTPDEWARFQEDDKAFAQRFDVVYMDSITVEQRLDMLRDQAREIRKEKNRIFSDAALRFIMDNYVTLEPDKHPNRGSKDVLLSIDMQLDADGYTKKEVGLDDIEATFAKIVEARQKAKLESLVGKIKTALQRVRDETGIQPSQIGFSSTIDYEALSKRDGEEWHQAFYRLNNLLTVLNAMPELMSKKSPEEVITLVRAAVEQAKRSATPSSSRRSGPASSGGAPASPPPEPFNETLLGIRSQELYAMMDFLPSPRDPSLEALLESLRTIYAKKEGESEADRIARLNPIEAAIHKVLYRRKRILGGTIWNGQVESKPIDTSDPLAITGVRVSTPSGVKTLKAFLDDEARKVRPTPAPPTVVAAAPVAPTGVPEDPISELKTILAKYSLNYATENAPEMIEREFYLIFNISDPHRYIENSYEVRQSLLRQALQKAALVDADTSKTPDVKKTEIEEIFVRAALEAGRMLTVDTFNGIVKDTKIEAYARSKGWEVAPFKDSEILDNPLRTVLQKYHLEYDKVELNATVYKEGDGLRSRLDILQTALIQIKAINDNGDKAPDTKKVEIKKILMRAMLDASKTVAGFDITTTPKLNAYAAEQGWPEAVNAAKDITIDVNAFFTLNSQSGTVRKYAQQSYEQLEMKYKIRTPDVDPQASLLFARAETTYNQINADVTCMHFNIHEYPLKLVILRAYAQYMNNTQFLSKSDEEKLAQAQTAFVQTLKTTNQFATKNPGSTPEDARSDLDKNLAALANIMAENMVALSQQSRSRH